MNETHILTVFSRTRHRLPSGHAKEALVSPDSGAFQNASASQRANAAA